MAIEKSITVNVEPRITKATASLCLAVIEVFMNQHPELEIIAKVQPDGTSQYCFQERRFLNQKGL